MLILAWLFIVMGACASYLYFGAHLQILDSPHELGDFLSGVAAVVSLPGILIVLLDNKRMQKQRAKQEAEANSLRQFQAFMTIHQALSHDFHSYLKGCAYYLELNFPKRLKLADFHAPEDIVSYLRTVHFSNKTLADTLNAIKQNNGLSYVAKEFCTQLKTFITFAQNTHYLDDDTLSSILNTHPCYDVYYKLEKEI